MKNSKFAMIDPEGAKALLETMGKNRPLYDSVVERYAKCMKDGNFHPEVCNPIYISKDGHLIDGQHRLNAIINTGLSFEMEIRWGISDEAAAYLDQNKSRSCSDALKISDSIDDRLSSRESVALAKAYLSIALSRSNYLSLTIDDYKQFFTNYANQASLAMAISHRGSGHPLLKRSGCQAAIFGALLSGIDPDKLSRFAECVNTGIINGLPESSAVVCKKYLDTTHGRGGTYQSLTASIVEQAIADFIISKPRKNAYTEGNHPYIKKF